MPLLPERTVYRASAFAIVLAFSLLCLVVPLLTPVDNWDMLGYAASVKSLYGMDAASIHASVFSEYQSYATAYSFEQLTKGSSYREVMHQDAEAFYQQIPFYKIRILYVLMLTLVSEMGVNVFTAMHFFSTFFAAAAFLTLYFGMRHQIHALAWIVAPVFYFFFSLELTIFQRGGVDSFSFFWVAMIAVAFFRRSKWIYPLLALSVLVRTDLILYTALIFAALFISNRAAWRDIFGWGIITLIAYSSVNHWSENLGWTALINFVFESNMLATHPQEYSQIPLSFEQYIGFIFSQHDWISNWFWVALGIAVLNFFLLPLSWHWASQQRDTKDENLQYLVRLQILSAISLAYICLHYLLFPAIFMRFFYGQCFISALALLATMAAVTESAQIRQITVTKINQITRNKIDSRRAAAYPSATPEKLFGKKCDPKV